MSAKNFRPTGIPMLRGSNLSTEVGVRLDDSDLVFVSPDLAERFARSVARPGDLVFTCWGTIGQVGYIDSTARFSEYLVSNKQMRITPNPEVVDSRFLYYQLAQPQSVKEMQSAAIGSSVPGFNLGQLRKWPVHLPPLEEQRRIACVLGALDDLIDTNRRAIGDLRALAQAKFDAANEGGDVAPFSEIAQQVRDGVSGAELVPGTPYLGLEHFATDGGGITGHGDASDVDSNKSRFRAGDVLFGKLRPYFRKVDRPGFDGVCSTEVWVLRPLPGWGAAMLDAIVSGPEFTDFAMAGSGGTRMPRANWAHVGTMPVAVPPPQHRAVLEAELDALWRARVDLTNEIADLIAARDELLPELMSGRVRVSRDLAVA